MPDARSPSAVSSYLEYLPAIFQAEDDLLQAPAEVSFVGRFLLAFEAILSGLDNYDQPGLEDILADIHRYFDPAQGGAPAGFLPWLASWVALTLREDWTEDEKRRIISQAVSTYRDRGTRAGLTGVLRAYLGSEGVEVKEVQPPFQLGVEEAAILGRNTFIGGAPPHYFQVSITLPGLGDLDFARKRRIAEAIIDQQKPAHTYYDLHLILPSTMQVGERSTVGVDTLLSERTEEEA